METDMSLRAPRADERVQRPKGPAGRSAHPARKHAPKKHHASDAHGKAHAKQGHASSRGRDDGDRRDRKGNSVWSNSAPPKYRKQRRPAKV
jgi:hypothetical protein